MYYGGKIMIERCIQCGNETPRYLYTNQDYISGEGFRIMNCDQCGLSWTEVPESEFDVSQYYPKEYYGKKNIRFNPVLEFLVKKFREYRANVIIKNTTDSPGRVLDIGCGRGLMLGTLKKQGWETIGTEQSEISSQYAREVLGIPVKVTTDLKSCNFPDNHFDAISLWHVLEHFPDPVDTLREIQRILKPNGLLLIEVPNFSSWQAKVGQGQWFHIDSPRHLYHFTPESLITLLRGVGFSSFRKSTLSLEFGPFGMVQTLLNKFTTIPNFFFSMLKNKEGQTLNSSTPHFRKNLLITGLLLIPVLFIGCIGELFAVIPGKGGVLRLLAQKKA